MKSSNLPWILNLICLEDFVFTVALFCSCFISCISFFNMPKHAIGKSLVWAWIYPPYYLHRSFVGFYFCLFFVTLKISEPKNTSEIMASWSLSFHMRTVRFRKRKKTFFLQEKWKWQSWTQHLEFWFWV